MTMAMVDEDGDGNYAIGQFTTAARLDAPNGITAAARYGNNSLLCKPSIASNDGNDMFIVFSLPADNDSTPDGQSFRDIWVRASHDKGATWPDSFVMNLTCTVGVEESFPVAAKLSNDTLHVLFQSDDEPGTALTNGDPDRVNDIDVLSVPTSMIFNRTAKCMFSGVRNQVANNLFSVGDAYPNPFNTETYLTINLIKQSDVLVTVTNVLGQTVLQVNNSNMNPGRHVITMDASRMTSGVYFYTVRAGENSVTKKLIVQK